MTDLAWQGFESRQKERGIDLKAAMDELQDLQVETPSWGYGDSGTRFKVFQKMGVPRNPFEKLEDAAEVHRLTGLCPSVALHIPWDKVDSWERLRSHASSLGLRLGAINPNVFQDDEYMLGSVCNQDAVIRRKAADHILECVQIMRSTGSEILSLWFADGTNYPGQADLRKRKRWMEESLSEVYSAMDPEMRMLIEYKFFEPAFYHTDLADWGMALQLARKLGPQAEVLVDTGHHAQGTNIAQIVAFLLDEGRLGGFHLNARKYADDDLIVGTENPFELFTIYTELASAGAKADRVAYMIDQSHNIEPKLEAMLQSVINCQVAYAKALIVDYARLAEAQSAGDVLGAHRLLMEAYETDVRPLLAKVRQDKGLHPDPIAAHRASDYPRRVAEQRGKATQGGAGYPTTS